MRRIVLSAVIVGTGVLALASVPAVAKWEEGERAHAPLRQFFFGRMERMRDLRADLDITSEQREEIKQVLMGHRTEIASTMKALRGAKVQLRDLVLSESSKESEIRAASKAMGVEIGNAAVLASELREEISPILTDEQHEMIDQFIASNDRAAGEFMKQASGRE